jgi:hypothetical protein
MTMRAIQDTKTGEWLTHDNRWTPNGHYARQFSTMNGRAALDAELRPSLETARAEGRDPVVYDVTL